MLLVGERAVVARVGQWPWAQRRTTRAAAGVLTFALVCFAWVFFRAKTLPGSAKVVASKQEPAALLPSHAFALPHGIGVQCPRYVLT